MDACRGRRLVPPMLALPSRLTAQKGTAKIFMQPKPPPASAADMYATRGRSTPTRCPQYTILHSYMRTAALQGLSPLDSLASPRASAVGQQ